MRTTWGRQDRWPEILANPSAVQIHCNPIRRKRCTFKIIHMLLHMHVHLVFTKKETSLYFIWKGSWRKRTLQDGAPAYCYAHGIIPLLFKYILSAQSGQRETGNRQPGSRIYYRHGRSPFRDPLSKRFIHKSQSFQITNVIVLTLGVISLRFLPPSLSFSLPSHEFQRVCLSWPQWNFIKWCSQPPPRLFRHLTLWVFAKRLNCWVFLLHVHKLNKL